MRAVEASKAVSLKKTPFRGGNTPPLSFVEAFNTVRLIPSQYSPNESSVLVDISRGVNLQRLFDFDDATNDRLLLEAGFRPEFDSIDEREFVHGIPYASVINAAYAHYTEEGNRFSVYGRNAWYAGLELATSQAEVIFHKTIELHEMGKVTQEVTYDEYLADFRCNLHDLRELSAKSPILSPSSYKDSQKLAENLFVQGALGLIYPSVRDHDGTCIACFRPALVTNVRKGMTYRFRWTGKETPVEIEIDVKR